MLTLIKIQNIALIPSVEINFGEHFNVLTGETGAGKSIIIGSLNFIFGDKLSPSAIRSGAEFAKVTAVFYTKGEEIIITRVLRKDGRSEVRINDDLVPLKTLKEVAGSLIDIHGQHDTERLLNAKYHCEILDKFGKVDDSEYKKEAGKLRELQRELSTYGGKEEERERLLDLYKYQINEIETANLTETEEDELNARLVIMRNTQKITENLTETVQGINSADKETSHAVTKLRNIAAYDEKLNVFMQRLAEVQGEIADIFVGIKEYLDEINFNDEDITAADDRCEVIKNIKRKYGKTVGEVLDFLTKTRAEYNRLVNANEKIAELKEKIGEQTAVLEDAAERLFVVRKNTAEKLEKELLKHLADLGMPCAKFIVQFNEDKMPEFYFSANVGEDVKPLNKVISGGEMSRLMLAVKTIANTSGSKTLVFDEIDAGISGQMGNAVANKLKLLSAASQIIVVTHLASIAAKADTHFLIEKSVTNNKTSTFVEPLQNDKRILEIARIIGGGTTAVAHAKALILNDASCG
jgi:DNA repair protein RecN (Recombination protein N)